MSTFIHPQSAKKDRVIYWIFTGLIVLLDAVVPAFFFNSPMAVEGIRHLGFPDYFRIELSIGKIIGGILLIFPAIPALLKEWAYVGFGISLISAAIGHWVIDGPAETWGAILWLAILSVSYVYFHKIKR